MRGAGTFLDEDEEEEDPLEDLVESCLVSRESSREPVGVVHSRHSWSASPLFVGRK